MDRYKYLTKRLRWNMLLIYRGLYRQDGMNHKRAKRIGRINDELRRNGIDFGEIPLLTDNDLLRIQNWRECLPNQVRQTQE